MRSFTMVLLVIAASCVAPAAASRPVLTPVAAVLATAPSASSEEIVARTNAERRTLRLAEMHRSAKLMQAAQLQAEQMATAQRMSHDLPDARYPTLNDRVAAVGYDWSTIGENVAEGYADAAGVVAGWMKSPGHRANIVSARFTEMGAGVATGTNGRKYFAQVFGVPR